MAELARIDKWLWAARIFKTRSIAADAIKNGRVTIGGVNVKPSRMVKVGETVSVRKPPVTYSFKVLKTIEQRNVVRSMILSDRRLRASMISIGMTKNSLLEIKK